MNVRSVVCDTKSVVNTQNLKFLTLFFMFFSFGFLILIDKGRFER